MGRRRWGLLRTIAEDGPLTMSELARRRGVSRQYIQKLAFTAADLASASATVAKLRSLLSSRV